jgi:hypothetical protein
MSHRYVEPGLCSTNTISVSVVSLPCLSQRIPVMSVQKFRPGSLLTGDIPLRHGRLLSSDSWSNIKISDWIFINMLIDILSIKPRRGCCKNPLHPHQCNLYKRVKHQLVKFLNLIKNLLRVWCSMNNFSTLQNLGIFQKNI